MSELTSTRKALGADSIAERARRHIDACWGVGLGLLIPGGIIAWANTPRVEMSVFGSPVESGSVAGHNVGLVLLGVGLLVTLLAIIATGVRLGLDSATRAQS